MIKTQEILDHLEDQMTRYFHENGLMYSTGFHNEMIVNPTADVEVVLKFLTGTITNNRISLPVQIIIEVLNEYLEEVKDALTDFSIYNNETLFSIEGEPDFAIKQFYDTPVTMDMFVENGTNLTTTLTISATYIIFEGAIFSNDVYVKINDQKLNGIITIGYNLTRTCDSAIKLGSDMAKNYVNSSQGTISIDLDLIKKDDLHKSLMENKSKTIKYQIKYFDGFIEEEYSMVILNLTQTITLGGTLQGRITFAIAG
ncbi:MAG: hypothetical protein NC087_04395 [Anaeroplasma bactoclasticum]|nr:hypothetical protein [Anaeroplasma bactoclasticum]